MDADGLFLYGPLRKSGTQHAWQAHGLRGALCCFYAGAVVHLAELNVPALLPDAIPEAMQPGPGWIVGEFVGYEDAEALESALKNVDALKGVTKERTERQLRLDQSDPAGQGRHRGVGEDPTRSLRLEHQLPHPGIGPFTGLHTRP